MVSFKKPFQLNCLHHLSCKYWYSILFGLKASNFNNFNNKMHLLQNLNVCFALIFPVYLCACLQHKDRCKYKDYYEKVTATAQRSVSVGSGPLKSSFVLPPIVLFLQKEERTSNRSSGFFLISCICILQTLNILQKIVLSRCYLNMADQEVV